MSQEKLNKSLQSLLPQSLFQHGNNNRNQQYENLQKLIQNAELPDYGFTDFEIQFFITYFASMDSNHFFNKAGVGEREGWVYSTLVQQRYHGLTHGQGRSGNLTEIQPKAAGSSALQILTHWLLKGFLKYIGISEIKSVLIYPFATGMALTQCLLCLKSLNKKTNKNANKVIILRIDQKTSYKCIEAAGLDAISIDNIINDHNQIHTNYQQLEQILQEDHDNNQEILCVMSISSCFAPWQPDDVIEVGKLVWKFNKFHLVNNAYGIQCSQTCTMVNKAMKENLIDFCVSSTDKNFLVPVGGAFVYSNNKSYINTLQNLYPGRCSINSVLDLFITILSMGKLKYKELQLEQKNNFLYLKQRLQEVSLQLNEQLIESSQNQISLSITLKNIKENVTELGSRLFHRGIMGARIIEQNQQAKKFQEVSLKNFGSHLDDSESMLPYITVASAIGAQKEEIDHFISVFKKQY